LQLKAASKTRNQAYDAALSHKSGASKGLRIAIEALFRAQKDIARIIEKLRRKFQKSSVLNVSSDFRHQIQEVINIMQRQQHPTEPIFDVEQVTNKRSRILRTRWTSARWIRWEWIIVKLIVHDVQATMTSHHNPVPAIS